MDFQDEVIETPPQEAPTCGELLQLEEGSIWEETVIAMVLEDHIKIRDPLIERDILTEVGDPLTEQDTLMEDHLMEEDPLDLLVDKDHLALKGHQDQ